ncbi:MAG: maleylpyruvate isomerase family mycothiol-dependent enzyme [Ilumatobacteraceae bacterium]
MEHTSYLSSLARDGVAFADACEAAGLGAAVTSCPGWSVADLLWHLTEVHEFWRTIVGEQRTTWEGMDRPPRPTDDDLLGVYRAGFNQTLLVLNAADPAQANWTWSSDHTAAFVVRRMAQETGVHRWDASSAAGAITPIEAELASDGIDEFLTHMLGDVVADAASIDGSVHLHCTDVAGEWTVRPTVAGGLNVIREHAKGDAAIRGAASDLLLVLWRRQDLASVDVVGDGAVAARFVAHTSLD